MMCAANTASAMQPPRMAGDVSPHGGPGELSRISGPKSLESPPPKLTIRLTASSIDGMNGGTRGADRHDTASPLVRRTAGGYRGAAATYPDEDTW